MNRRLGLSMAGAALLLFACDDGGGGGGGVVPNGPVRGGGQQSSDLARYVRGLCTGLIGCEGIPVATVDQCVAQFSALLCAPGYATVSLPGVDGCIAAFDCDWFENPTREAPTACKATSDALSAARGHTIGQVGDSCSTSYATGTQICAQGSICQADLGECGTCMPFLENGQPCDSPLDCKSLRCGTDLTCQAALPDGSACESNADCENSCIDGMCGTEGPTTGQPCTTSDDCEDGFCDEGTCALPRLDGAVCTSDEQCDIACVAGKCAPSAACGAGREGDPCYDEVNCQASYVCSFETDRCIKAAAVDEPCDQEVLICAEGTYCDFSELGDAGELERVCKALKADGTTCNGDSECESDECGDDRKCVPILACREAENQKRAYPAREIVPGRLGDGSDGLKALRRSWHARALFVR